MPLNEWHDGLLSDCLILATAFLQGLQEGRGATRPCQHHRLLPLALQARVQGPSEEHARHQEAGTCRFGRSGLARRRRDVVAAVPIDPVRRSWRRVASPVRLGRVNASQFVGPRGGRISSGRGDVRLSGSAVIIGWGECIPGQSDESGRAPSGTAGYPAKRARSYAQGSPSERRAGDERPSLGRAPVASCPGRWFALHGEPSGGSCLDSRVGTVPTRQPNPPKPRKDSAAAARSINDFVGRRRYLAPARVGSPATARAAVRVTVQLLVQYLRRLPPASRSWSDGHMSPFQRNEVLIYSTRNFPSPSSFLPPLRSWHPSFSN